VTAKETKTETLCCSFCAKSRHEVARLIAGPTVAICDECVWLCTESLADQPVDIPPDFYDDVVAFMRVGGLAATAEKNDAG